MRQEQAVTSQVQAGEQECLRQQRVVARRSLSTGESAALPRNPAALHVLPRRHHSIECPSGITNNAEEAKVSSGEVLIVHTKRPARPGHFHAASTMRTICWPRKRRGPRDAASATTDGFGLKLVQPVASRRCTSERVAESLS